MHAMKLRQWILIVSVPVALVGVWLGPAALCENCAMADSEKTLTITVREKKTEVKLVKGDVLEIKLEMRAGTGYSWAIAKNDAALLEPKGKPSIERPDQAKPGGTELQVFRFRAKAVGTSDLELHYKRPFEKDQPPGKTYKITLQIVDTEKS
jgi:inhibitor of cysteine peptidase